LIQIFDFHYVPIGWWLINYPHTINMGIIFKISRGKINFFKNVVFLPQFIIDP